MNAPRPRAQIAAGFYALLTAGTAGVCVATMAGFLGRAWWVLDLFAHFRVQYFVLLATCAAVLLASKRWGRAGVAAAFAAVNLALIVPVYFGAESAPAGGVGLRIASANVHSANRRWDAVREFVRQADPDVLVVIEVTPEWAHELDALAGEFPFRRMVPRSDNFGIALLSRVPTYFWPDQEVGHSGVPSIMANVVVGGAGLTVVATHALPPINGLCSGERNRQLEALARLAVEHAGNLAIVGDLNVTPWSPFFRDLLKRGGLRDSRQGHGVQATWPVQLPPMRIPVDHCLVSAGVSVVGRRVGPSIGSDHLPIIVDLRLPPFAAPVDSRPAGD